MLFKEISKMFNYDAIMEFQRAPIKDLFCERDVIVKAPTGKGKSFIFQSIGLYRFHNFGELTIIISPLNALSKDQKNNLANNNINAYALNSSVSKKEQKKLLDKVKSGDVALLYVAPERLKNKKFIKAIENRDIYMVAVDEAHFVVSDNTFRPSFLKIKDFIKSFKKRPVVSAFTATLDAEDTDELIKLLGLKKSVKIYDFGSVRTNIGLSKICVSDDSGKYNRNKVLDKLIKKYQEKGKIIVYCSTVKKVEAVEERLRRDGYLVSKNHSKMAPIDKEVNQDKFKNGDCDIMVATTSFGAGVDISDIRTVILYNMPLSIDILWQELGRAGRDDEKSWGIILYNDCDYRTNYSILTYKKSKSACKAGIEKLDDVYALVNNKDKCLHRLLQKNYGHKLDEDCGKCSNCKKKKRGY